MKVIKDNVKLELSWEEINILQDACSLLDKIANTIEHDNFQWLIFDESGEEINTADVREMADKIDLFTGASPIEVF